MMSKLSNISFEFFPPKSDQGMNNLSHAAAHLQSFRPEFFSVTSGAGGSTREGTLATIEMLTHNTSVPIAPHLACIGSKREELVELIQAYKTLGLKRIVALRGDLPSGMGQSGELKFANELVKLIRDITGDHFHIEVAAYPEFHPQTKKAIDEIAHFKAKIDAGANSAITQYFYNADAYFYFQEACAKQDIFVPIIPGIMPITQFASLARFSDMCGAEIPRWIRRHLEGYGDDADSIRQFGEEVVQRLSERLLAGGAPGLHFYTLNHFEPSAKLIKSLERKSLHLWSASTSQKDHIT